MCLGYYESADGEFVKSDIASFVSANKLPLVSVFTRESAPEIFESAIKKQVFVFLVRFFNSRRCLRLTTNMNIYMFSLQVLLFVTQNESEKVLPEFEEAAKSFKGKVRT